MEVTKKEFLEEFAGLLYKYIEPKEKYAELEKNYAELEERYNNVILDDTKDKKIAELQEQIEELNKQVSVDDDTIKRWMSYAKAKEEEAERTNNILAEKNKEVEATDAKNNELRVVKVELMGDIKEKDKEIQILREQIEQLNANVEWLQSQVKMLHPLSDEDREKGNQKKVENRKDRAQVVITVINDYCKVHGTDKVDIQEIIKEIYKRKKIKTTESFIRGVVSDDGLQPPEHEYSKEYFSWRNTSRRFYNTRR